MSERVSEPVSQWSGVERRGVEWSGVEWVREAGGLSSGRPFPEAKVLNDRDGFWGV